MIKLTPYSDEGVGAAFYVEIDNIVFVDQSASQTALITTVDGATRRVVSSPDEVVEKINAERSWRAGLKD